MTRPPRPAPIAYLVNQYPQASHSFIRREIAALEARGLEVARFTLRRSDGPLADPADEAERGRTRVVLGVGAAGLAWALLREAASRPRSLLRALRAAVAAGRASERGVAAHLAYLAEACVLRRWLADAGASHVHAHFGTNSTAVAMLCRILGGPPYSFTAHGPEEFDSPRALGLGAKVAHAAFAVAVSDFGRSQLYRWCDLGDWPKVEVIRCGVDAAFLGPHGVPAPEAPRLVCVGRLAEQKGQLLLVEAAALLAAEGADFEITLVGDGPLRGPIERLIAAKGLGSRVRLAGWMGGAAVRGEILRSRALVLPSFAEGLPVVLMESLALGRPVVTTYVAGIPELVEPGRSGWLVPAGSVVALARALREVLGAAPADLEAMGRAGRAKVADRHDATAEAARLAARIARGAGAPRPAVFLDRDGTIIEHVHYIGDPADVRLLPGAARALRLLRDAGHALVVVTNQSAVGRGIITEAQVHRVNAEMGRQLAAEGASVDAVYFCPDVPTGDDPTAVLEGSRRKPGPGMLVAAASDLGLDLAASWMVGDMISDVLAGANAGCRGSILVETGKGREDASASSLQGGNHRAADLSAAADLILRKMKS